MKAFRVKNPIFGEYLLKPHLAEELPGSGVCIGYVDFGDDTQLSQSIYTKGEWCNRQAKPWRQPVVRWYAMEKPDGTPLL